ncbi:hypothetical protein YIM_37075 [Amycolatopsis sp. YIM 10]|nr:hypothetical protein YIM_37075 [Amycolatopsis sp. YIM 10]
MEWLVITPIGTTVLKGLRLSLGRPPPASYPADGMVAALHKMII